MIQRGIVPIRPPLMPNHAAWARLALLGGWLLAGLLVAVVALWSVRPLVAAEASPGASASCQAGAGGAASGPVSPCRAASGEEALPTGRADPLGLGLAALAAGALAAAAALAAWDVLRGRFERRMAPSATSAFWICDACHSFSPVERRACYHCRAPRAADAMVVSADTRADWQHRFGHPWEGVERSVDPRSGPDRS